MLEFRRLYEPTMAATRAAGAGAIISVSLWFILMDITEEAKKRFRDKGVRAVDIGEGYVGESRDSGKSGVDPYR